MCSMLHLSNTSYRYMSLSCHLCCSNASGVEHAAHASYPPLIIHSGGVAIPPPPHTLATCTIHFNNLLSVTLELQSSTIVFIIILG